MFSVPFSLAAQVCIRVVGRWFLCLGDGPGLRRASIALTPSLDFGSFRARSPPKIDRLPEDRQYANEEVCVCVWEREREFEGCEE